MTPPSIPVLGLYPAQVNSSYVVSPTVSSMPARITAISAGAIKEALASTAVVIAPWASFCTSLKPKRWPGTSFPFIQLLQLGKVQHLRFRGLKRLLQVYARNDLAADRNKFIFNQLLERNENDRLRSDLHIHIQDIAPHRQPVWIARGRLIVPGKDAAHTDDILGSTKILIYNQIGRHTIAQWQSAAWHIVAIQRNYAYIVPAIRKLYKETNVLN